MGEPIERTSQLAAALALHDWGWAGSACACGAPAKAVYLGRYLCEAHLREALRG